LSQAGADVITQKTINTNRSKISASIPSSSNYIEEKVLKANFGGQRGIDVSDIIGQKKKFGGRGVAPPMTADV